MMGGIPMRKALKRLLNLKVTVEPYAGMDGTGDYKFSVPKILYCFRDGATRIVRNTNGEEVTSALTLYLDGNGDGLGLKDRITLSDGKPRFIINIAECYDERGNIDHLEVYL
jgi:hypothetical protein